jgi:hypothetical protein
MLDEKFLLLFESAILTKGGPCHMEFLRKYKELKYSSLLVEFRDSHEGRNSGFIYGMR